MTSFPTEEAQPCVGSSTKADCPRAAERHSAYTTRERANANTLRLEDDFHAHPRVKASGGGAGDEPAPFPCLAQLLGHVCCCRGAP